MDQTVKEGHLTVNPIPPPTETDTSGTSGHNESEKALPPDPTPNEDCSAWLQVCAAFCLNLNTW